MDLLQGRVVRFCRYPKSKSLCIPLYRYLEKRATQEATLMNMMFVLECQSSFIHTIYLMQVVVWHVHIFFHYLKTNDFLMVDWHSL